MSEDCLELWVKFSSEPLTMCETPDGSLVVSLSMGLLLHIKTTEKHKTERLANLDGSCGIAYNSKGSLIICDLVNQQVKEISIDGKERVLKDFDEIGPDRVVCDKSGLMVFTDSGPHGETNIENPIGSVHCLNQWGLTTWAKKCLAGTGGLDFSPSGDLYLCETHKNRILKFNKERQMSVFYQFSGPLPVDIAVDSTENLWVARTDNRYGRITVVAPDGTHLKTFSTLPLVSGIIVTNGYIWMIERSTKSLYRLSSDYTE